MIPATGKYEVYKYPYRGGTNWGEAEVYCVLDPALHGSPEALAIDTNGTLYVGCYHPTVRPMGLGVYACAGPLATPVLYAAMDDLSGHRPKDMDFAPDGRLCMWIESWGILRWPPGGDLTEFDLRIDRAGPGGIDFGPDGYAYGCLSNSYADVGYYDINSGIPLGQLINDPDLAATTDWYNMDFGPDYNGNGVCDMYVARYYNRVTVYDGESGAKLGDLFTGYPLRSVTGVVLPPTAAPPTYFMLK